VEKPNEIEFEGKTYSRNEFALRGSLPNCDICVRNTRARYDAKYMGGSWAFMCRNHFKCSGAKLGLGLGQLLITYNELKEISKDEKDNS